MKIKTRRSKHRKAVPLGPGGRETICEVLAAGSRLDDPPLSNLGEPDRQYTDKLDAPDRFLPLRRVG